MHMMQTGEVREGDVPLSIEIKILVGPEQYEIETTLRQAAPGVGF
jgi:hypothetical protein